MTPRTSQPRHASIDMLRAFVALADSLNLSVAARALGVTRQTLRRHIDGLEDLRGVRLFHLAHTRYALTEAGRQSLPEARDILTRCAAWDSKSTYSLRHIDGFEHMRYRGANGQTFYAQQHSVGSLKETGLPLMQEMFRAWGQSLAQLYDPAMDRIRPYLVIYRRTGDSWICADVGEASAYARWFGQSYAQSAKGSRFDDDNAGEEFNAFISKAYLEAHDGGAIRLDHVHAVLPRETSDTEEPIRYQRLMAACTFPDGNYALAVLVAMTNRVRIAALENRCVPQIPDEMLMEDAP